MIFLVGDDRERRDGVEAALKSRWPVRAFPDGKTVLDGVQAGVPDGVVTDMAVVAVDGFALLRALRADPATREVPVIVFAATADPDERVAALEAGAADVLGAPIAPSELVVRLAMHVETAHALRAARTREVTARADAVAARAATDQFLALLSHELRTPLTSVLGWARMVGAGAVPPERVPAALEAIERSARLQARLVDDLVDASRIVNGTLAVKLGPVLLAQVAAKALDSAAPLAAAKGIHLRIGAVPADVVVNGDPGRLQQIIGNLLANAIKFTPAGGRVSVRATRKASTLTLTVTDTGCGIAREELAHLFDRLDEGGVPRGGRQGGLGFGLAIVRHLVERHHGRVSATSDGPGRGATFTVELPVLAQSAAA